MDKRCYDWSMVFKATIDQSQVTLLHSNEPRNHCAKKLVPISLIVSGGGNKWEIYADTRV